MANKKQFFFTKFTLKFSIFGMFIFGFTAFVGFGLYLLLEQMGFDCPSAMRTSWTLTALLAIILPYTFVSINKRFSFGNESSQKLLIVFNFLEYGFIQWALYPFFSTAQVACYTTDGQNGIELAFTALIALPILILLSLLFDAMISRREI